MSFSEVRIRPLAVFAACALALTACSGASSDDTATKDDAEKITNTNTGALAEMVMGNPDATVTVIEYASVTCPHCASFHQGIFPTIKENYIDTGKIKFIFREFPTAPVELSVAGSMLARCAADKGGEDAYFLVLDSLFKTQRAWAASSSPRDHLLKIATQAGMDEAAFDVCVRREELLDFINETVTHGRDKYDVKSTPSFILNGTLRHFASADDFSAAIDKELEKSEE